MRRLKWGLLVAVAIALACSDMGGPSSGSPRGELNFVLQDSTYKPLLSARDSFWTIGTAVRSKRLRVIVSKLRMPRSQRMTWPLPSARMYSALMSKSVIVAAMPRLSSTGFPILPTARSNE